MVLAGGSVFLLLVMEWLFFVTKPSMFSALGWRERIWVLLATALAAAVAAMGAALVLTLAGRGARRLRLPSGVARLAALAVPTAVLTATALLLVENFTKTVFGFNVGDATSALRYLYAAGLVGAAVLIYRRLARVDRPGRWALSAFAGLLAVSAVAAAIRYQPHRGPGSITRLDDRELVNVLMLSSDGVEARRMSVYGAERETTPFLASRADEFLIGENHFTNAATTGGSQGSWLTGKLPLTTGVTQQGDVFRGRHVYEHLPGVLRELGYQGIEFGLRPQADARDQNLRRGFHVANFRRLSADSLPLLELFGRHYPAEQFFVGTTFERVRERLLHVLGVADMEDTFAVVTGQKQSTITDQQRIDALQAEIERAPRPFFAQAHLMGTHGERFEPVNRRFSRGKQQTRNWDLDFYDDAILDFDGYIRQMVDFLEETGELERTVLIINSDHGMKWATFERIPLLMRFPRGEHRGRLAPNTQRIDLAPTVLAYLGVGQPDWMEGRSLLDAELAPLLPILSTGFLRRGPFLPWLSLVQCQRWFELNLDTGLVDERIVAGHTAPCATDELFDAETARRMLLARLESSERLPAPLFLGERLDRLRSGDADPAERSEVLDSILDGLEMEMVTKRWDDEIAIAQVHWDFWTYGTRPAGLVVRNPGDEPLVRRLTVRSGRGREFPVRFRVDDGEVRREYVFERPGELQVELAAVPSRSERLFLVWSEHGFRAEDGRALGVKLAPSFGDQLARLTRRPDSVERQELARRILAEEMPVRWLGDDMPVAGVYFDGWTRGTEAAGVVVRNDRAEARVERLVLDSGGPREFPVRVLISDGRTTREHVLSRRGRAVVELPAVPPGAEALFVVWSDREWTPASGDRRRLGVKLSRPAD